MKPEAAPPPRRRRLLRRLLVLALALAVAAVLLYATRRTTLAPFAVRAAQAHLRERFQCELEVAAVGGSWWRDLELEGVRIERTGGAFPLERLEGGELRASYSLLDLLRGRPGGLRSLELEAAVLALDLSAPADDGEEEPREGGVDLERLSLPRVATRLGRLELALPGERRLRADEARFSLTPAASADAFELVAGEVRYDDPATGPVLGALELSGERTGGALSVGSLRVGDDVVRGSAFLDLSRAGRGELAWDAELVFAAGRLDTTGLASGSRVDAVLEAAEVDLAFLAELAPEVPLRAGVLRAGVELSGDLADPLGATALATVRVAEPVIDGRTYEDLVLEAFLDRGLLEIPRLRLHGPGEELVVQDASAPLDEILGGALPPSARGRLELSTALLAAAAWDAVRPAGAPIEVRRLRVEARLEGGRLAVEGGELDTSVGRIDLLGGTFDARDAAAGGRLAEAELDLAVSAAVPDLGFVGVWIGTRPWAGTASVRGRVTGTPAAPSFDLDLDGRDLVLQGVPLGALAAAATVDGRQLFVSTLRVRRDPWEATAEGTWTFADGRLEGLSVTARGPEVVVTAAGDLALPAGEEGLRVRLEALGIEHAGQRMQLVEGASLALGPEGVEARPFVLESELGRATVSAGPDPDAAGASRIAVELEDFDPMPLLVGLLPEGWSFSGVDLVAVARVGERLAWEADLAVERLALGERLPAASLACDVAVAGSVVELRRLAFAQPGLGALEARGSLPLPVRGTWLAPGPLRLELDAELADLAGLGALAGRELARAGAGRLEARLEGEWTALRGTVEVGASGLVLVAAGEGPIELSAELSLGDALRLVAARVAAAERASSVTLSGSVGVPADLPARLAGWPDDVLDAPLDLSAAVRIDDLSALVARLGSLERLRGGLAGGVAVRGTLRRPLFSGSVDARGAEVRFPGNLPALREVDAHLELEGRELRVGSLSGELGGAPVEVSGRLPLDAGGTIELRLTGTDVLLTRTRGLIARANADITVSGTPLAPRVAGTVELTGGRFTRPVDVVGTTTGAAGGGGRLSGHPLDFRIASTPPLSDLVLDLAITAAEPFPIKNNVMRGSVRPDLKLIGEGDAPVLEGTVFLGSTTLTLPGGTLRFDSGVVIFRREKPLSPELALTGSSKMLGYDLSVQVSGDLDQPEVVVTATPPLPPEDALLLLLTGRLPEQLGAVQAGQTVVVYLTRDYLSRWFADEDGDGESVLDRLDIEYGTDVTRSGQPTYLVRFRLEGEAQGTGRAAYLTTERDVYDRSNFGYRIVLRAR